MHQPQRLAQGRQRRGRGGEAEKESQRCRGGEQRRTKPEDEAQQSSSWGKRALPRQGWPQGGAAGSQTGEKHRVMSRRSDRITCPSPTVLAMSRCYYPVSCVWSVVIVDVGFVAGAAQTSAAATSGGLVGDGL